VKVALGIAVVLAACGAPARSAEPGEITAGPDEMTLRHIRRDAATYLSCQVPAIRVELGQWSGSQGNVIAAGCGFYIHYYVVCQTHGQCGYTVAD
jgi:hypothetical protein